MEKEINIPKLSKKQLTILRDKERAKYTKWYFENMYWVEDFPGRKHYRKFNYNDPAHEKRFQYLTSVLTKYFKFKTFLDVGCGMGHIVQNLLKLGYPVRGVEVSRDAIKHYVVDLQRKGIVVKAGIEKLPFRSNQFDLVFCSDVLEHIPFFDIGTSINELTRVTKKYLILTINLDHPCKYHPTILSRETWEDLFLASGRLGCLKKLQQRIEKITKRKHNEYDWFIFEKN